MKAIRCGILILTAVTLVGLTSVYAQDQKGKTTVSANKTSFLRIKRDVRGDPLCMQTAIVRYASADKTDTYVDLVGAVHVGEKSYYAQLNDRFENYDVVLYELVVPKKGMIPRPGQSSDNPLAFVLKIVTGIFQWELQLECVDYTPKHFVHADLTHTEMAEILRKRGDDAFTIGLGVIADMLRQRNLQQQPERADPDPKFDIVEFLSDPEAPAKIKRILAEEIVKAGDGSGLGPTLDTILIADRNAACMKVLAEQLKAGKKRIAIFYGAAHMPDFERQIGREYGMRRQSMDWVTVWDLRLRSFNLLELLLKLSE